NGQLGLQFAQTGTIVQNWYERILLHAESAFFPDLMNVFIHTAYTAGGWWMRNVTNIVKVTGAPSLTFDGTAHTITRAAGSWITDGFTTSQIISAIGTVSNNGSFGKPTSVTATVITFASGLTTETVTGTVVGATIPTTEPSPDTHTLMC